tara:strand:+ start:1591 stop:1776 length:186 start_codon:yes stop_codon:yes gene_type:complete
MSIVDYLNSDFVLDKKFLLGEIKFSLSKKLTLDEAKIFFACGYKLTGLKSTKYFTAYTFKK